MTNITNSDYMNKARAKAIYALKTND